MRETTFLSTSLAAIFVALLPVAPAPAAPVTFLASFGSDASPCTRAQPCLTLGHAAQFTDPGGTITCLDSGPYGSNFISSLSFNIDCAGIFVPNTAAAFGAAEGVVLRVRNATASGLGGGSSGFFCSNCAALIIENCRVVDFTTSSALGIRFLPAFFGNGQLIVRDTQIDNNGNVGTGVGGGIQVAPSSGGSAGVVLDRVKMGLNVTSMVLNSNTGGIGAVMTDSVVSSSRSNGILSISGAGTSLKIERSHIVNNVGNAIQSAGANTVVRIGGSEITGNQTGLSTVGGGQILSYQTNEINGNGADGAPTGVLTAK